MADTIPEQVETEENMYNLGPKNHTRIQKQLIRIGSTNQLTNQPSQISPRSRIHNLESRDRTVKVVQSFRQKKLDRDIIRRDDQLPVVSRSLLEGTTSIKRNQTITSRNGDSIFIYNRGEKNSVPPQQMLAELQKSSSDARLPGKKFIQSMHTTVTQYSKESPNNFDAIASLISENSDYKSISELDAENKNLRNHLRELNKVLDNILEREGIVKLTAPKKLNQKFEAKPPEEQLRTYVQEIKNNEKILEIKQEEVKKLKERIATLKNPNYLLDVQEKIDEGKRQIQELQKQSKDLKLFTHNSGRNLASIENDNEGVSNDVIKANLMEKELAFLQRKNQKIKQEVLKFEEKENDQQLKIVDLELQIKQLEKDCKRVGIELSINAEKQRYIELANELQDLDEKIKIITKRNENFLHQTYHKELQEMKAIRARDEMHLAKLNEMLEEQGVSLKEELGKETLQNDKAFHELYGKLRLGPEESGEGSVIKEKRLSGATPLRQRSVHRDEKETNGLFNGLQAVLAAKNRMRKNGVQRDPSVGKLPNGDTKFQRNRSEENLRRYKDRSEALEISQRKAKLKHVLVENGIGQESELLQRQESLRLRQREIEEKLQKKKIETENAQAVKKKLDETEEEEAMAEKRRKKIEESAKKKRMEERKFNELSQKGVIDSQFESLKRTSDAIKKAIESEPKTNEGPVREGVYIKGETSVFILPTKLQNDGVDDPNDLVFDYNELENGVPRK